MRLAVALLLAYLLLTFVGSAAVVRLWPHGRVARRLRRQLAAFPLLPILLLARGLQVLGRAASRLNAGIVALFVRLSGRPQYRRSRYGSYLRLK